MPNPFAAGLVVYFRMLDTSNRLVASPHLDGRNIVLNPDYQGYLTITDASGALIGIYAEDWVSCILPLQTVGPGTDENPQK